MSWCDKLSSTPSVGIRFEPLFLPSDEILRALAPILKRQVNGEKFGFEVTKQETFNLSFSTEDGYFYGFEANRIYVEFQHKIRIHPQSGAEPVANLITEAAPYTKLLANVTEKLIEVILLVSRILPINITRIGIVSTTQVKIEDAPPGIIKFVEYMSRPWKLGIDSFSMQVAAKTEANSNWSNRCSHYIIKQEDPENLPTLRYDWQRVYSESQVLEKNIEKILADVIDDALEYFEDIAEGNLFDEEVITDGR